MNFYFLYGWGHIKGFSILLYKCVFDYFFISIVETSIIGFYLYWVYRKLTIYLFD